MKVWILAQPNFPLCVLITCTFYFWVLFLDWAVEKSAASLYSLQIQDLLFFQKKKKKVEFDYSLPIFSLVFFFLFFTVLFHRVSTLNA